MASGRLRLGIALNFAADREPPGGQAPAWRLSEPQSGGDGASASSTIPFGFDGMFWRLMGY